METNVTFTTIKTAEKNNKRVVGTLEELKAALFSQT